jgi:hypothetical protein
VRRDHSHDEGCGRQERGDGDDVGEPSGPPRVDAAAAGAQDPPRAEDVAAIEDADRREVDQVEEKPRIGERASQVGIDGDRRSEAGSRS